MVAVLLLGCGGDSTTDPTPGRRPDPARPTTIAITPAAVRLAALGASEQLTAEVRDQDGNAMTGVAVSWASSAAAVATVSASGLVTAAGNGTATITATAGSASGSATITVAQEVSAVAVTPTADTVVAGDTVRLAAEATDANEHPVAGAEFDWASSDTLVAMVDDAGLVTGVGPGEAQVTATAAGVSGAAALAVVAPVPTTVAITPDTVALTALGQTAQLTAEVRDQTDRVMEGVSVSWSSADTAIAAVDSAGLVTAIDGGATTIAAAAGEASSTAVVTVMQSAGSVLVSPAADTIALADTLRLAAEAFDENGHRVEGAEFRWSSSDISVASVDGAGLVTGVADGTATITAAAGDASGASEITVGNPDRAALVALYEATDGPNWRRSDNWLTDAPLDHWYGVRVDGTGVVAELRLTKNELSGPIPPELGALATLVRLHLGWNDLTGAIPPELGALARLEHLVLRVNGLSGPIPRELGGLTHLVHLNLDWNDLTGPIPPELGDLAGLEYLDLGPNDLTGPIPPELGNLADLAFMELRSNDLSGSIPPELGRLTSLEQLVLNSNDLTGTIPPELKSFGRLLRLDLANNQLSGSIPPDLGRLPSLEYLDLGSNDLTGTIPLELASLADLAFMELRSNDLSGTIPPELGRLASLEHLELFDNRLSGPIPPQLGDLAKLKYLNLSNNNLTGSVPPELGRLGGLLRLFLSHNNLSGSIPIELGGLTELMELALSANTAMSGPLPTSLTNLRSLQTLFTGGTTLCAPSDEAFLEWLAAVPTQRVARCEGHSVAAYLVQAVQSRDFPVPLVAGEQALLRVFPTAGRATSEGIPPIRARFYVDGRETHVEDIPGTSTPIPTEVYEGDLSQSANAEIPGAVIQPGLEMVVEIDPDGTLDSALGVAPRIPALGRLAVDVRTMPVFDLTVVPFLWTQNPDSTIIGAVADMAAEPEDHESLWLTGTILPVGRVEVTAHPPVLSSSNNAFTLLRETKALWALEGGRGHYLGMMSGDPSITGAGGVAQQPGRVSFSGLWEERGGPRTIIAHEIGHNMSLAHALTDPRYPYPNGSIGAWGYDSRNGGRLLDPDVTRDRMAGGPWISDYHFSKALRHRLTDEGSGASAAAAPGLLLWGGVDAAGLPFLEPVFLVDAPPALPQSPGEYRLTGQTKSGAELFALSFDMSEVADGDGSSSFAFALPVGPGWAVNFSSMTLTGPSGSVTLDGESDLPMVILRNPTNGKIRGILRNPRGADPSFADAVEALSTDSELEVLFSRGIPNTGAGRR